ncbi:hypothetical protein HYPSUDRAFT_333975 [Hypholoma sublateritium FD-334 SS-4]|uniref:Uncharacterized protein n=1 Tax=Hypholoma sublateritium (strain FD-334 SS-4) TaxID=945553 RepID=A0A0D2KMT9_HYPSF|nr:hypothetical protein HYPSUDRAFT_333975 [Hypholoma sublateritium FD-334 SS-4]
MLRTAGKLPHETNVRLSQEDRLRHYVQERQVPCEQFAFYAFISRSFPAGDPGNISEPGHPTHLPSVSTLHPDTTTARISPPTIPSASTQRSARGIFIFMPALYSLSLAADPVAVTSFPEDAHPPGAVTPTHSITPLELWAVDMLQGALH